MQRSDVKHVWKENESGSADDLSDGEDETPPTMKTPNAKNENKRPDAVSKLESSTEGGAPEYTQPRWTPQTAPGGTVTRRASRAEHERLISVGEDGLRSIDMMRQEAEALKQSIVDVIRSSYKDLAPAMKIAKVTEVVVDMVEEAMTLLTKFVKAYESQRESFRTIFTEMNLISDEMHRTQELKVNEEMQTRVVNKLYGQRAILKEHASKLKGFVSPADLDRFTKVLAQFEQF